jgi:RND superfamily putative drug exporter
LAGGAVLAVMIGLSIVGLGVKTGPPDFWTLPKSFEQRRDYEAFKDEFGSAWSPPYQILVKVDHGTITDPARLKTLAAWQRQLAARPDVSSVLGPGVLERRTRALADARQSARQSERLARRSLRDQRRLSSGLARAHAGMRQVQSGLADATDGAQLIAAGGSTATAGAQRLNDGLRQARSGASRLRSGLTSARAGAEQIHAGANRLTAGSIELASGLDKALRESSGLAPGAEQLADGLDTGNRDIRALREPINAVREQLLRARQELAQLPPETRSDEHVQAALDAIESSSGLVEGRTRDGSPSSSSYGGVLGEIDRGAARSEQAAKGARSLQQGAAQLNAGLVDARDGAQRISVGARRVAAAARTTADGLAALEAGARQFDTSLGDLTAGSRQLAEGVTRLRAGADDLAARLSDGARSAAPLSDGLEQMQDGVRRGIKQTKATTRQLEQSTQLVRATRSGYMTLALIDTGDRSQSEALSTSLNVDRGGNAAVITIFGRGNTIVWGHPLRDVLEREADSLARQIDGNAYVGGAAGVLQDFDHLTSQRMIVLITLVALITWLALTFVLRTRILATIAVVLNLLTVGATFGVLVLCFQGSSPLLGGGGYIDSISLGGIFAIVFALSIDYALFLLLRMREGHDLLGSSEAAVAYGLRTTAGVVTGAATVMIGVFAAFSSAQMINLRQLGVGLVVAVLLDATLVRLVLLPTAIRLFGERAWRDSTARR